MCQTTVPLSKTVEQLLEHSVELEAELELHETESPQWLSISNELNDVRQDIGWFIAHEYKQQVFPN